MSGRDIYLANKAEARRIYDEMIKFRDESDLPKWKLHGKLQLNFIESLRQLGYYVKLDNNFGVKEVREHENLELLHRFAWLLNLKPTGEEKFVYEDDIQKALLKERNMHKGTCKRCNGSGIGGTRYDGSPYDCNKCINGIAPMPINEATFRELCKRMS